MIDLHFHALPGLDDGPETMEESVALCRKAAEEGTTRIVATPHVLRELKNRVVLARVIGVPTIRVI